MGTLNFFFFSNLIVCWPKNAKMALNVSWANVFLKLWFKAIQTMFPLITEESLGQLEY